MSGKWIQIGNVFIKMWRGPMADIRMHLTASKYKKHNWPRAQLLVLKFSAMFEPKPCFSWAVPSHQLSSQDTKAGLFRETWLSWEVTVSQGPLTVWLHLPYWLPGDLEAVPLSLPSLSPSFRGRLAVQSDGSPGFSQFLAPHFLFYYPTKSSHWLLSQCPLPKGHGQTRSMNMRKS